MKTMSAVDMVLQIVGGLNWGLVGLFQLDLVAAIFGGLAAPVARVIYVLVGLAALYGINLLNPVSEDPRITATTATRGPGGIRWRLRPFRRRVA